jgi:hypothetical protein
MYIRRKICIFSKIELNFLNFKGKCFLNGKCESYSIEMNDTDVNSFGGKLYVFSQSQSRNDNTLRMRRFSSTKQIVFVKEHGLQAFQCFKDGFKNKVCDQTFKFHEINALWKLDSNENEGNFDKILDYKKRNFYRIFFSYMYF